MKNLFILSVAFLFALSSCEMKDAAMQSANNSGRAADNSDALLATSKNGYAEGRTSGARKTRREELANLVKEDQALSTTLSEISKNIKNLEANLQKAIDAKDTPGEKKAREWIAQAKKWQSTVINGNLASKLVNASAYMKAFEFQLWKSKEFERDTQEKRDELFLVAIQEFFKTLGKFVHQDFNYSVKNPSVGKMNLLAMALSLQIVSEHQERAAKAHSFDMKSIYTLMAEALQIRQSVEKGETSYNQHPNWVIEVAKQHEMAEYLLNLRYNLFTAQVVKSVLPETIVPNWMPDLEKLDQAALSHYTELAAAAVQTKNLLSSVGMVPKLSSDLDLLKVMDTNIQTAQGGSEYRVSMEGSLAGYLQELAK